MKTLGRLSHLLMLCILLISIPLQGLAAAGVMLCAAQHHQPLGAVQQPTQADGHQHHADAAPETSSNATSDAEHQQDNTTTSHYQASKDKCSSCSACCVGAVMVSSPVSTAVSSPSSEKIELVFSSHLGHISDSLERPPRA